MVTARSLRGFCVLIGSDYGAPDSSLTFRRFPHSTDFRSIVRAFQLGELRRIGPSRHSPAIRNGVELTAKGRT
jgi:hypothetical protein